MALLLLTEEGLSPRVRVKLVRDFHFPCRLGSIPACAGEAYPPIQHLL